MRYKTLQAGIRWLIILIPAIFTSCGSPQMEQQEYKRIQEGFITPQEDNKPWCYYYWIGDDISMDGVTRDLEAMKDVGLGAVLIGNINPDGVDGKVPLFSDPWWEITTHVVNEGHRLGIDIGFFNCPGWSMSGGPWVSYDKAMRHLVFSETSLSGPGLQNIQLEKPAAEFQDTYVLAFRSIGKEKVKLDIGNATISCSPDVIQPENLLDGDTGTEVLFRTRENLEYIIDINTEKGFEARSLVLYPTIEKRFRCDVDVLARTDGQYHTLTSFPFNRKKTPVICGPRARGPLAIALPPTRATSFRLVCRNLDGHRLAGFSEITFAGNEVLDHYVEKSLGKMHETPQPEFDTYIWASQAEVEDESQKITETIDLSENMDVSGQLTWDVPEGEWTIIRMGMTPTRTMNHPAAPQGTGYEIDKASRELVRFHFDQYIGKILEHVPEESRPAFKYVVADSYEMGSQNWTDGFEERFTSRFGYDPVPFLPVFSGRIVSSVEESDRFLWDLRRAVADDVANEYVGGLKQVSNEHNLKLWLENYGHWGFPSEFLMYGGQSDLVSGEYWNEGSLGKIECKAASSAAHIYGKPVTSAEAFTASGLTYLRHPAMLKAKGDWSFTEGINHQVLHVYIHQPDDKRVPGINAYFSTEFNRHNTWFSQGRHWVDYLRRCQHMLQEGKYVADILYFIGEDAPKMSGITDPDLPPGYSFDYINAEVILNRLSVEKGTFVLPDGMKYRILALPEKASIRPETLARLAELVEQGGTILGARFKSSPSLQNYPDCDVEIKKLSSRLWGEEKQGLLTRRVGKGYVLDGMGLQEALDFLGVEKDFEKGGDVPVLWTHRTLPGMEIYFLSNQSSADIHFTASFRTRGLQPQLWDAVTGEMRMLPAYRDKGERTEVPMKMTGHGSCFVVFSDHPTDKTNGALKQNFPEFRTLRTLDKDWTIEFRNKKLGPSEAISLDKLDSWTTFEDEKAKYYSGTAQYATTFNMEKIPRGELFINLGEVGVMAEVKINGQEIGGTWMSPFRLNTRDFLKAGENRVEIEVVNIWRNRLVKDKMLPEQDRYTWLLVDDIKPDEELQMSGLIGPVTIEAYNNTSI